MVGGWGGCEEDFEVTEAIERAAREADEQETRARQLTLDGNLTWDAFDRVAQSMGVPTSRSSRRPAKMTREAQAEQPDAAQQRDSDSR